MTWKSFWLYQLLFGGFEARQRAAKKHAALLKADAERADALAMRLTRIWLSERERNESVKWKSAFRGKRFYTSIAPGVEFQMVECGVARPPIHFSLLCRQDEVTLYEIGCTENGQFFESPEPNEPNYQEIFSQFAAQWMPVLRRGCWLSGVAIEATAQEKDEWMHGFISEGLEYGGLSEEVEWEARRVAAAFEVKGWRRNPCYIDFLGIDGNGNVVEFCYWVSLEKPRMVSVGYGDEGSWWNEQQNKVMRGVLEYDEVLARGLYRLGVSDFILDQLPPLSAHEKLELRLSLPREFWPKAWLDEKSQGSGQ